MAKTQVMNHLLFTISTMVQQVIEDDARENLAFLKEADAKMAELRARLEKAEEDYERNLNSLSEALDKLEELSRTVIESTEDADAHAKALLALSEFLGPRDN